MRAGKGGAWKRGGDGWEEEGEWGGLHVHKGPVCLLIATKHGDEQKCDKLEKHT